MRSSDFLDALRTRNAEEYPEKKRRTSSVMSTKNVFRNPVRHVHNIRSPLLHTTYALDVTRSANQTDGLCERHIATLLPKASC